MKITVAELQEITDRLFAHLRDTEREEVEIPEDYYWMIPQGDVYDPTRDPTDLTIGQLSDDWTELIAILREDRPAIGYGFVWLSAILRIVGEKTVY